MKTVDLLFMLMLMLMFTFFHLNLSILSEIHGEKKCKRILFFSKDLSRVRARLKFMEFPGRDHRQGVEKKNWGRSLFFQKNIYFLKILFQCACTLFDGKFLVNRYSS